MPKSLQSAGSFCFSHFAVLLMATQLACPTGAREVGEVDWRTGSDFQDQLWTLMGVTWDEQPLREGLQNLANAQRIAIFLDRRVHPGQKVTISLEDITLEAAVRRIARQVHLSVGFVGPVIYVGPPLTCTRIATVAAVRNQQVEELPPGSHQRLLRRGRLEWDDLTEPRQLILETASTSGLTIPNIQTVSHDLWFRGDLPAMTFAEKATLLLAGFDMSFRFHENASQIYLTRFPRAVSLEKSYRSSNPEKLMKLLQSKFPQAFVTLSEDGKSVDVRTTMEDHQRINRIQRGKQSGKSPRVSEKRYTMNVENKPVGPLLQLLAKKLHMRIEFSGTVTERMKIKLVSASVREVDPEALLQAMATPAGLEVQIAAGVIYVTNR